jgi:Putative prokaryotic signal transducing protein/zinc-ribbon domain
VTVQHHAPERDSPDGELVCPSCGRRQPDSDRFCARCGMPLVHSAGGEQPAGGERRRRARKIKPQYTEGATVVVAHARNQVEAEFIAGLLLEEGIPCVLRAAIAGYAPVVGTRDVLVAESGAQAAREALAWQPPGDGGGRDTG